MDWTVFGNVVNIIAALVTIGSPVFSIVRAIAQNERGRSLSGSGSTASTRTCIRSSSATSQVKTDTIPWYIWVKTIGRSLGVMFDDGPLIIYIYPIAAVFSIGAIFLFCFLVNIPTAWMNTTQGLRVFVLCAILAFSLHFSVTYAEHAQLFLQEELEKRDQRAIHKGQQNSGI